MTRRRVAACAAVSLRLSTMAWLIGCSASSGAHAADVPAGVPRPRIEARSDDLLVVGLVDGDRMTIHVSRLIDNAPVRDAVLTVLLRGTVHPTLAEADGSFTLRSTDLELPGAAAAVFQIVAGDLKESLKGALDLPVDQAKPEDKNTARQLGWWVLNFAVCIGFLMLWNRRRKNAAD